MKHDVVEVFGRESATILAGPDVLISAGVAIWLDGVSNERRPSGDLNFHARLRLGVEEDSCTDGHQVIIITIHAISDEVRVMTASVVGFTAMPKSSGVGRKSRQEKCEERGIVSVDVHALGTVSFLTPPHGDRTAASVLVCQLRQ